MFHVDHLLSAMAQKCTVFFNSQSCGQMLQGVQQSPLFITTCCYLFLSMYLLHKPTFAMRNGPTTSVSYTFMMSYLPVADNDASMAGLVIEELLIRKFKPSAPLCFLTAWTAAEILSSCDMSVDRHAHTQMYMYTLLNHMERYK